MVSVNDTCGRNDYSHMTWQSSQSIIRSSGIASIMNNDDVFVFLSRPYYHSLMSRADWFLDRDAFSYWLSTSPNWFFITLDTF